MTESLINMPRQASKYSIPDRGEGFDPEIVKRDIARLESIESKGRLSSEGYAELRILKDIQEYQKKEKEKKPDASA